MPSKAGERSARYPCGRKHSVRGAKCFKPCYERARYPLLLWTASLRIHSHPCFWFFLFFPSLLSLPNCRRDEAPAIRSVVARVTGFSFVSFIHTHTRSTSELVYTTYEMKNGYDPSAGSPTETLLRLLLPLKDQVRPSFSPAVNRNDARELPPEHQTPTGPSEGLTKSFNR